MNSQELLKLPNVLGHGTVPTSKIKNGVDTGVPSIKIYVLKKLPLSALSLTDVIPLTIETPDGIFPTDVIQAGDIRKMSLSKTIGSQAITEPNQARVRPVIGGTSISPGDFWLAGTGGLVVQRNGVPMLLSNNHVLRMSFVTDPAHRPQKGDIVRQPAIIDSGSEEDIIGRLEDFIELEFPGPNQVDCALARLTVPSNPTILGLPVIKGINEPVIGMKVSKSGRSSGVSAGTVTDIGVTIQVNYSEDPNSQILGTFTEQTITTPMLIPGDSGSVLVSDNNEVVALGFAGSDQLSIATPISEVFNQLNITLPMVDAITDIMKLLKGRIVIWGWNSGDQTWMNFDSNAPRNDLSYLTPGQGYWIQSELEQSLGYNANLVYLVSGWNLIGWR